MGIISQLLETVPHFEPTHSVGEVSVTWEYSFFTGCGIGTVSRLDDDWWGMYGSPHDRTYDLSDDTGDRATADSTLTSTFLFASSPLLCSLSKDIPQCRPLTSRDLGLFFRVISDPDIFYISELY
jgi:hypothetical protein